METKEENLRQSKEEVKLEFAEYKKAGKLELSTLQNLLSHCNIIPEIIESYLRIL